MSEPAKKFSGRFIVIDGPDGAGKSTQIALLAEYLRGRNVDVLQTRDPGGTAIGDSIRRILLDNEHREMVVQCEMMLYMASRSQLAHEVIRPALEAGRCVLCDRYVSATIAYQGAGGADEQVIRTVAAVATGGLSPDLTVILDVPAGVGLGRVPNAHDRMEAKGEHFHRQVRESFLRQARDDPEHFAVIIAAGSVEQVQESLRGALDAWSFPARTRAK